MWSCSLVSQVVVHHDLDLFTPSTFLIFSRGKKANNQGRSSIPPQGNRCCVQRKEPLCSKVDCRKKNTYPLKADKKKYMEKGFVDNMDVVVFFFYPVYTSSAAFILICIEVDVVAVPLYSSVQLVGCNLAFQLILFVSREFFCIFSLCVWWY